MPTLPRFAFVELGHNGGSLLCTEKPFYVAHIWRFKHYHEFNQFLTTGYGFKEVVGNYMIVVAFYGSLEGKLNAHPNVKTEVQSLLKDMADHYLQTKINSKPRFYDRFKIQRNDRF